MIKTTSKPKKKKKGKNINLISQLSRRKIVDQSAPNVKKTQLIKLFFFTSSLKLVLQSRLRSVCWTFKAVLNHWLWLLLPWLLGDATKNRIVSYCFLATRGAKGSTAIVTDFLWLTLGQCKWVFNVNLYWWKVVEKMPVTVTVEDRNCKKT